MGRKTKAASPPIGKSLRPPPRRVGPFAEWITAMAELGDRRSVVEIAEALSISRAHANGLLDGTRRPGLDLAVAIEEYTNGVVTPAAWGDK